MALKADGAPLSLRPMSLRPGGGNSKNPFERFAKGAGANTQKAKTADTSSYEQERRKPRSEIIQYTRERLEAFQETNIQAPPELSNFAEIQINTIEPIRQPQVDTRDWRGRADTSSVAQQSDWSSNKPSSTASAADVRKAGERQGNGEPARGPSQTNGQMSSSSSSANVQATKMQTAEEVGRVAWTVGATKEGNDQSLREVKGILNKLTPEKFDNLSKQLIQLVTNKEVLETTITMLFETAVAQPSFVRVYADLAASLSQALPDNVNFRSTLLNTCQEEFEGATTAREKLSSMSGQERADSERQVKLRSLGNIKFIAELFNKGIVAEKIVVICIDMLLATAKADPKEDNVELLCELVTKAGKKLEKTTRYKAKFEGFFNNLDQLSKQKQLPVRAKFMIIDLLDLRRSSWIPRRDVLQAKKIEDIRAEAHAELGMVPTAQMPMLAALPALPQAVVGPRQEVDLFPAFRGGDDGWQASGKLRGTGLVDGKQHTSAFWLEEDPLAAETQAQPAPSTSSAPPAAAPKPKREPLKNLSDEQRESRAKSLFSDYISTQDTAEATAAFEELNVPGFAPKMINQGLIRMLEDEMEQSRKRIAEIIVKLLQEKLLSASDVWPEFEKQTARLTDTMMDAPYAPKALGYLFAKAVVSGVADLKDLEAHVKDVEEVFSRRDYGEAVFKYLQESTSKDELKTQCKDADLSAEKLFKADEEIDGPGIPSVDEYLQSSGLQQFF